MKKRRLLAGLLAVTMLLGSAASALAKGTDETILPVAGGSGHTAAVTKDGKVYTWGTNRAYQLGVKGAEDSSKPMEVKGITAVAVAAGYDFTAALSFNGTVWVWGMSQHEEPVDLGLTGVVKLAAGQTELLALRNDGSVWQWTYGQEASQVPGLSQVVDISCGGGHNLALTVDGRAYAWGSNDYGQLGNGTKDSATTPVRLPLMNVVDIAAGFSHSLAVTYDGKVYGWGNNEYGQLGDGTTQDSLVPVRAKSLTNITKVAAGNGNSLALTGKGTVYAWGYGEYGQLGNGSNTISASTPVSVNQLSKVAYITCGLQHCMAVTESGVLYVWGRNRDGQIGNSKNTNCNTPQRIREGIYVDGVYRPNVAKGASGWAAKEIDALYDAEKVFPALWSDYSAQITRAEFAALLVSLYENVKSSTNESSGEKYQDIKDHPFESEIRKAVNLGLLNGTSDTTIAPDRALSRQEGVKILCAFISKAKGVNISEKPQNLSFYTDAVDIASWAGPYVYYAYDKDIMKGDSSNRFNPQGQLTREQALIIVQRLVEEYGWAE